MTQPHWGTNHSLGVSPRETSKVEENSRKKNRAPLVALLFSFELFSAPQALRER